jgi:hypothetical protein
MQTATGVTRLARRADEFAQVVEGALAVVPVLVNRDLERAKQLLAAAKLALGTVTEELSPRPPGTVLHQDPPTGRTVRAGTAINLRVAIGVTVPNVVDAMLSEATEILEGVGLVVGDVTKEPSAKNAEKVLSQRPFAGQTASLGSRVNLVIATGIPVPELLGLNQSQAATALQQVLLKLGTVSAGAGEGTPGTIIEQYPEAGDLAALETEVNVTVVATSVSGPHREAAGSGSRALAADVAGRLGPLLDLADTALREVGGVERLRAKRNVWQGYEASLRTAWDEASAARAAVERAGGDYAASRFEELVAPMPEDAEADFFETKRQRLAECRDVLSRYSPRGE